MLGEDPLRPEQGLFDDAAPSEGDDDALRYAHEPLVDAQQEDVPGRLDDRPVEEGVPVRPLLHVAFPLALWLWLGVALGFLGQPQGLQKFVAIESAGKIKGAALIAVTFNTMRQYFPLILGLCCRILFPSLQDAELSTPTFISSFFPNFMGGLMLAAVFAAIMSTNSSLLLQGTAELSVNVLRKGFFRNIPKSERFYKLFSQICTLIFGAVALLLAMMKVDSVFSLNLLAWAGLAASFGPGLILAIYWKKTTHQGILAGIVTGTLSAFLWYHGGKPLLGLHQGTASFFIASAVVVAVSLVTYRKEVRAL